MTKTNADMLQAYNEVCGDHNFATHKPEGSLVRIAAVEIVKTSALLFFQDYAHLLGPLIANAADKESKEESKPTKESTDA